MLPKPIYEALPYGYVLVGVLTITWIDPIFGKICGALMIVIGLFIYQTRRRYRHHKLQTVAYGDARHAEAQRTNSQGEPISRAHPQAQQNFHRGEESYAKGNYAEARQWYRQAAEQGSISAQVNLGVMYVTGEGGPKDYQEAVYWYSRAADQGDALAQFNLGAMYVEGHGVAPNPDNAIFWYRKAASQGNAPAQFSLGVLYEKMPGTLHLQEALQWYRKAAEQGYAPAQVNLGVLYAEGRGVRQNFQEALRWYQAAATSGYPPAQFNLGVMYLEGQKDIPKDLAIAYVWFARAAAQGDADARQLQQKLAAQLTSDQKAQAAEML